MRGYKIPFVLTFDKRNMHLIEDLAQVFYILLNFS
jgi:hypothetical protein